MLQNPHVPADLATFTETILNGKLHFLCSAYSETSRISKMKLFAKIVNKNSFQLLSPKP